MDNPMDQGKEPEARLQSGKMHQTKTKVRGYCQWTSLHGFNFLAYPDQTLPQTVFWISVIAVSVGGACFVVGTNIRDFADSSVSYDLATPTQPLDDVFFPSLVVCNMNQLRSSFVWAILKDPAMSNLTFMRVHQLLEKTFVKGHDFELLESDQSLIDAIMNTATYNKFYDEIFKVGLGERTNDTVSNVPRFYHHHRLQYLDMTTYDREKEKRKVFLNIAAQFRYGEMISRVNFAGHGIIIDLSFSSDVSDTCTWITPLVLEPAKIEFPGSFLIPRRAVRSFARNGINNGLHLLLDAETYDYASPIKSKAGFIFTVLHHLDIAILKQTGSIAMPGQSVQVAITPTLTRTKASTRTRFNPVDRQCYFDDEVALAHLPPFGYRYDMSNCLYEASLQKIGRECNCTPSFFAAYLPNPRQPCEGPKKFCMARIMEDIGADRFILDNGITKECLATCHDQTHHFLVTSSAYPNQQSFHLGQDFCLILNKLRTSCGNEKRYTLGLEYPRLCHAIESAANQSCSTIRGMDGASSGVNATELALLRREIASYASANLVVLDIYLRDPYVKLYLRREKITVISFIGNVGGLLGLFLGFSFISVVEIFYMFLFASSGVRKEKPAREEEKEEEEADDCEEDQDGQLRHLAKQK